MKNPLKDYMRKRAIKAALKVLTDEIKLHSELTEKGEEIILDVFNSGVKINLKQAKRRALGLIGDVIERERNKQH